LFVLKCTGNEAITNDGIEKLVAKCHSIKTLRIYRCRSISDRSVLQIADHCPALEFLDVDGNDRITAVSLSIVAKLCLKLEIVYISGLRLVSQESLDSLSLCFPHIEWNADDDEDYDEEEEDWDQDHEEEEEEQEEEEEEEEF
jgi:hypothetical protein